MPNADSENRAVLIGVSEQHDPRLNLPAAAKDVQALKSALLHPHAGGYGTGNVRELTGANATCANILDHLNWLRATPSNATALLYFSGHGMLWQGEYLLLPADANLNTLHNALPANVLRAALKNWQAQQQLLIFDCCHAAGLNVKSPQEAGLNWAAMPLKGAAAPLPEPDWGRRRAVLSSSQAQQESYIRKDGLMSVFTYCLLEALLGGAQPEGGASEVLVSDVIGHVERHVPLLAQQDWGSRAVQQPYSRMEGNFPIMHLPPDAKSLTPLSFVPPNAAGININTDGGTYIGTLNGTYVQGNQTITNIHAPVIGSTLINGDGNRVEQGTQE